MQWRAESATKFLIAFSLSTLRSSCYGGRAAFSLEMLRLCYGLLRQMLRLGLLQVLDYQHMLRRYDLIPLRLAGAGAARPKKSLFPRRVLVLSGAA